MPMNEELNYLQLAVQLAKKSPHRLTSFSVGAVIVSDAGALISTGYTRELGEHWHAEEVAIEKARRNDTRLKNAHIYCSMEPCGKRRSRKFSCAEHIINSGITHVTFCLSEPPIFVVPIGASLLREAGIIVQQDESLSDAVIADNEEVMRAYRMHSSSL